MWASLEDAALVLAPSRFGKTLWLSAKVLDAPGAAVATSIKPDVFAQTAGLRGGLGTVWVFNPQGVGDVTSNLAFDPVAGAADSTVAIRRAAYMVQASDTRGVTDQQFWESKAARVLRCYLHAADLAGRSMSDVARWIHTDDASPLEILRTHTGAAPGWADALAGHMNLTEKMRSSVDGTLQEAVAFMDNPATAAAVCPPAGGGFHVEAFLASTDTLYLIADDQPNNPVAGLFNAFVAEFYETARLRASRSDGGRLDPPLTLALDEVANICPVPLATWASSAGGLGIRLLPMLQSHAQLSQRWGSDQAEVIWGNAHMKLVYPGLSETDCERVSKLVGEVDVAEETVSEGDADHRERRSTTYRRDRIIRPEEIRTLPKKYALVVYSNAYPTVVKLDRILNRRAYKKWKATGAALPELTPLPTPETAQPVEPAPAPGAEAPDQPRAPQPWLPQPEQPDAQPGQPSQPAPRPAATGDNVVPFGRRHAGPAQHDHGEQEQQHNAASSEAEGGSDQRRPAVGDDTGPAAPWAPNRRHGKEDEQ